MSREKKKRGEGISRRDLLRGTTAIGAMAMMGSLGFPSVLRAAPPVIKIGHIHPLSGFLAFDGKMIRDGLICGVKAVNDAGGIKSLDGANLELLDADSEGKPELAVREVERLDRAGVVVILGSYQSNVTLVGTQQAEKLRIPYLVPGGMADEITERGFKYTFRLVPTAKQIAPQALQYIGEIAKGVGETLKTISYLHDNSPFGYSMAENTVKSAPKYGMEVTRLVPYSPKAPDFSTEIGKIKDAGADLIAVTGYLEDGIRVLRTFKELRVKSKGILGIGNGGFNNQKFADEVGILGEYVMDANTMTNPRSTLTTKAFAYYKAAMGEEMPMQAIFSYQSVLIIADAIERAKSTDRSAIRDALARTRMTQHILPQVTIAFGPDGQNTEVPIVITQILKGKVREAWPPQYSVAKPVFPCPP